MLRYLLRRILLAVPTLLVVSMLAFGLVKSAPGDPVVNVFGEDTYNTLDPQAHAASYRVKAERLGLHLPTFYFSLTTRAYPDTLWRIFPLERRERLEKLIGQSGNWLAVRECDAAISATVLAVESLPESIPQTPLLRQALTLLLKADRQYLLDTALARITVLTLVIPQDSTKQQSAGANQRLHTALARLDGAIRGLRNHPEPHKLRIPALHWYGLSNQYHHWLIGLITGNMGLTRAKREVWTELKPSLIATVSINGLAILLAYLIAVPLGVEMARRKGRRLDRWGKRILFFLYSTPVFWLGALLIMLFVSTDWGRAVLPSVYFTVEDWWVPGEITFVEWWGNNASRCVLPILILTLYAVTVLALQMRAGMLGALKEDYVRTARAKGVGEEEVYWHHAFRNALFPIITVFASVLPGVLAGSLVVETMFNFPGIGTKTLLAYSGQDMPLLSAIMMLAATLTIVGSLLADILYAWADPRVRFAKEK